MGGPYDCPAFAEELEQAALFVRQGGFRRICLQFPDHELQWSPWVVRRLRAALRDPREQPIDESLSEVTNGSASRVETTPRKCLVGGGRAQLPHVAASAVPNGGESASPVQAEEALGSGESASVVKANGETSPRIRASSGTLSCEERSERNGCCSSSILEGASPAHQHKLEGSPAVRCCRDTHAASSCDWAQPAQGSADPSAAPVLPPPDFYVIADGGDGRSCCVDEVSAKHVDADCILHFGHTCMTQASGTPAWHVLPCAPLNTDVCSQAVAGRVLTLWDRLNPESNCDRCPGSSSSEEEGGEEVEKKPCFVVVVYALQFAHAMPEVQSKLQEKLLQGRPAWQREHLVFSAVRRKEFQPKQQGRLSCYCGCCLANKHRQGGSQPVPAAAAGSQALPATAPCSRRETASRDQPRHDCREGDSRGSPHHGGDGSRWSAAEGLNPTHDQGRECEVSENGSKVRHEQGGLEWQLPAGTAPEDVTFLWIGPETAALTILALVHNKSTVLRWEPESEAISQVDASTSRALMRRYYLVERAKDASIVGIVVATAGMARVGEVVGCLRALVKASGKKSYTVSMSRVTPPKLANFPECDIMVLVACPESVLVDSKEYYVPLITPFEAELAFGEGQEWTGDYRCTLTLSPLHASVPAGESLGGEKVNRGSFTRASSGGPGGGGEGKEGGDEQEPRFSLIKGGYAGEAATGVGRRGKVGALGDGEPYLANDKALVKAAGSAVVALAPARAVVLGGYAGSVAVPVSSGSQFLSQRREYKGMEAPWFMQGKVGEAVSAHWAVQKEIVPSEAVEGATGRAAVYEGEGM